MGLCIADGGWLAAFAALSLTLALGGCASESKAALIGARRPPVGVDQVHLYLEPPTRPYESMAVIDASSAGAFVVGAAAKGDVVIRRLTDQAARLGANGLLLQDLDGEGGAMWAGAGLDVTRDHALLGLGLSGPGLFAVSHGRGLAIWVEPGGWAEPMDRSVQIDPDPLSAR